MAVGDEQKLQTKRLARKDAEGHVPACGTKSTARYTGIVYNRLQTAQLDFTIRLFTLRPLPTAPFATTPRKEWNALFQGLLHAGETGAAATARYTVFGGEFVHPLGKRGDYFVSTSLPQTPTPPLRSEGGCGCFRKLLLNRVKLLPGGVVR